MENLTLKDNQCFDNTEKIDIAVEAIQIEVLKLERLEGLYHAVQTNGVCRASMEALCDIYPAALNECAPPATFTVLPTKVNIEYANESFFQGIADAFKWVIQKIVELLKAIVQFIVDAINWFLDLFRDGNKGLKDRKNRKVDELVKDGPNTEEKYEETYKEFMNKVLDDRRKTIALKAEVYKEHLEQAATTELAINILNDVHGYRSKDASNNIEAIIKVYNTIFGSIGKIVTELEVMHNDVLTGDKMTESLSAINKALFISKDDVADHALIFTPFSYQLFAKTITDLGGMVPANFHQTKDLNPYKPVWFIADSNDRQNDIFWIGSIKGEGGKDISPNPWQTTNTDGTVNWHYSKGKSTPTNKKIDTNLFKGLEVSSIARELSYFENETEKLESKLKDVLRKSDAITKSINSIKKKDKLSRTKAAAKDRGIKYSEDKSVWPINGGNGTVIAAHEVPSRLSGSISRMINPLSNAASWWMKPLQDNLTLLKVNSKLVIDYSQYVIFMQQDIEAMLNELEG